MSMGSIMYLDEPYSQASVLDSALDALSQRGVKNQAITEAFKTLVGIEIGPITKLTSQSATTVRFPASGTHPDIHADSEFHIIADNGYGSSNSDTQTWDTPVWYDSKSVTEATPGAGGYIEFTYSSIPCTTDFYLRVINGAL